MPPRLKALRLKHWLLLAAFVVAAVGSAVFATRFVAQTVYWSMHREEPIEGWMPLRYVAHSHGVEPSLLFDALDLPPDRWDRRPIRDIAAAQGVPIADVRAKLEGAIAEARLAGETPPAGQPQPPPEQPR
jgi:hypothetical protein